MNKKLWSYNDGITEIAIGGVSDEHDDFFIVTNQLTDDESNLYGRLYRFQTYNEASDFAHGLIESNSFYN